MTEKHAQESPKIWKIVKTKHDNRSKEFRISKNNQGSQRAAKTEKKLSSANFQLMMNR